MIFLDIDGVLQPLSNQKRFDHDDIAAVFYDWKPDAVKNLKSLCEKTQAEFVISSDWRSSKTLDMLKLLFKIHGLDIYVVDKTDKSSGYMRDMEIEEFLIGHPDIGVFAILDDSYRDSFERRFPQQFVYCDYIFDDKCYQRALSILEQEPPSEKTVPEPVLLLRNFIYNGMGIL